MRATDPGEDVIPIDAARRNPTRRPGRRVALVVGLVVALLVLVAATIAWIAGDPERVRQTIERSVSSLSGKPFSIDGPFDYELGLIVTVRAERLRWSDDKSLLSPLLDIDRASVSIDLPSLLSRTLRVTDLQVRDAALYFDWSDDRFNWGGGAGEPERSDRPIPVMIDQATLDNVALTFRHPHLADDVLLQVVSARHLADEANRLVIAGDLRLDDRDLRLDGRIGPLPELLAARAIDLQASLTGPLGVMTVTGSTAALADMQDLVLDAGLRATDAGALAQRLRLPLETTGDVALKLSIDTQGGRPRVSGNGHFGGYAVDARLVAGDLVSWEGLEADITLSGPSARDLATLLGRDALPDNPFDVELRAKHTANGLELQHLQFDSKGLQVAASGVARSVDVIRDIDLDLQVEGNNFTDLAVLLDLDIDAPLPYRMSTVIVGKGPDQHDELDARLQLGDMTARLHGTLSETDDLQGSRLQYDLNAPDASRLPLLGPTMPAKMRLQSNGRMLIEDGQLVVDDVKATLGAAKLTGRFRLRPDDGAPHVDFEGRTTGPDLGAIINHHLPPELANALPPGGFSAESKLTFSGRTLAGVSTVLLADSRIAFQGQLDLETTGAALSGDLTVTGKRLADWLKDVEMAAVQDAFEFKSQIQLSPQALRLDGLTASLGGSQLAGTFDLSGEGLEAGHFDLRLRTDDLSRLLPETAGYRPAVRNLDLQIKGRHAAGTLDLERLQATMGELEASVSGKLQYQPTWSAQRLKLGASGPRLSDLGSFRDHSLAAQPFTLNATIVGDANNQSIGDLQLRSGDNDLAGHVTLVPGGRPRVELDLRSDRLALDEFFKRDEVNATPARGQQPRRRVFQDDPLPFGVLDNVDVVVKLRIDELLSQRRYWRNVIIDADVDNRTVRLKRASLDAAAGKLNLSGTLAPSDAGRALSLEIEARDAMLATESMTAEEIERLPRHGINARLTGVGETPHELASSLDGFVWVVGGQGYGPRAKIAPVYGDLLTGLLTAINPAQSRQADVRIDCDGAYLEVEQGRIRTAPAIVLKTERIVVVATGEVDLATEKLDITIETTPLRGVGLGLGDVINPLTKLSGTLRQPAIILDPKGALIEGGAAVATYGLSIVAKNLAKRLLGSRKPCERIGKQALEIRRQKDPDNLPELAARFAQDDAATDRKPATTTPDQGSAQPWFDLVD